MIYYDLLDKISSILEDKIEEILFLIENDKRNQRYKFTGEESLYSYTIVLDDLYKILEPLIENKTMGEVIGEVLEKVMDTNLKKLSLNNTDIAVLENKYFCKTENEEEPNYLFLPEMKQKIFDEIMLESIENIKEADDKGMAQEKIKKIIEINLERKKEEILNELEKDIRLLTGKEEEYGC